jgi:HlyD family secretion protein
VRSSVSLEHARPARGVSRRAVWLLLGVVALGAAAVAATLRPGPAAESSYQTDSVTRGSLFTEVTATGTLSPSLTVQVGSQVSGRLLEVLADFNQKVTKGQVVARIDPRLFEADVARAQANLRAATAAVQRAEAEFQVAQQTHNRTEILAQKELISQTDIDREYVAYRAAEAQLASARAAHGQSRSALETAQLQLQYTTITAPIDGVVISRDVEVGQTVAASFTAPQLFSIAGDLREMEVHTNVSEADVGQLRPEMPVSFRVDAYPNEDFPGTIKEIRYSPKTVQNVVTYDAVVGVKNADLRLRPGMTANVSFETDRREDVLLLPSAALRFQPKLEEGADPAQQRGGSGERTQSAQGVSRPGAEPQTGGGEQPAASGGERRRPLPAGGRGAGAARAPARGASDAASAASAGAAGDAAKMASAPRAAARPPRSIPPRLRSPAHPSGRAASAARSGCSVPTASPAPSRSSSASPTTASRRSSRAR